MGLKIVEDNLDNVDAAFHSLYTEKDGKFHLTGVDGMKTQEDITKLTGALEKERNDHKQVRARLALLGDRKIEDVLAILDRVPELEAAAAGKLDEKQLDGLVEARLRTKVAPVERELNTLKTQLAEKDKVIEGYTLKERTRAIHDAVRQAASAAKLLPEALEDALMLGERVFELDDQGNVVTRDGVGVTPGVQASVWLTDMQAKRPHWWGSSQGGGAGGSNKPGAGGANPWTAENWNMTEQGRILTENRTRAEQLAKAAGTSIGGGKPAPRGK